MDLQTLVAAYMVNRRRPAKMNAAAEDRYYNEQITLSRPRLRLVGLIATTASVILLVGIAQA